MPVTSQYQRLRKSARSFNEYRRVQAATKAGQVYICSWSHSGWQPVHIHVVVQPAWNGWSEEYDRPGPFVQAAMFQAGKTPSVADVEEVCGKMKKLIAVLSR
jgi:hypothetical protein